MHAVSDTLRRPMLLLFSLLLAGCAGIAHQSAEPRNFWRGTLVQNAEGYWFEPCGLTARHPVALLGEPLAREYARQSLGDGWPVYIEAFGRVSSEGVELTQPLLVGGSLKACDVHLSGIKLRAVATRDNAVFDLREQQIRVHYRDSLRQLGFKRPEGERLGAVRRWQQTMTTGGGRRKHQLLMEIEKRGCEGPRGGWYALTLSAEVDGRFYDGCARLGDLEQWRLFTHYRTSDALTTRRLSLQLEPDGKAHLLEDYLNEQPVIERSGRWQQTNTGRLQLRLDSEGASGSDSILTFQLDLEGRLKLTHFHPAYGRELELLPAGEAMMQHPELDWWR
ncbi:hypothetical protein ABIE60_002465 [Marinobacterium sp. MBR-109]